ncbi:ATP synthase F0 subunit A [Alloscardovia theropitheci]|uniref:ATP synthase subunit a n=1 Tax=Alloscardovia theropitheci TaxID=2496842 RepID=A0A4R0QZK9_9BIFI|nr:F0F1 ATP synthase subunit A [Alloscardovia theropitheci]TCD54096.1 ATP synthase F0 subunit A [Alloscardovia theropitheci]
MNILVSAASSLAPSGYASLSSKILADNGPELPSLNDFLPPEIIFAGTPFAINRIMLVRMVATVVILLVLGITAARAKVIPGRWQGAVEWVLGFVRDNIVYQILGELRGKKYVPMITTMFMTILVFNLCGVIPGANIAATATIAMPLVFALWTLVQYWAAGISAHGLGGFLKEELFPAGVPWPVYILLTPIQLLEIILIRPFSLTLRLFANMLSGHLLVAITLAMSNYYLIELQSTAMKAVGAVWFLGGFALTGFEIFVAALQAFIFCILSCVYINQSLGEE